ncbi:GrpB-like predicted nucleotidyltransferase (UPF0157 family) [Deinobacterium chartae]|uniref:GrpB-like predicted nucleotidyltransferase (UPF0157 family) n=1 Tax=Deinobacterium chartae TaxID=521158 RepID=A0A841HW56_9DEIO|nr:GrpB family protein [Deinobacterium chartae]MBB6096894.1 GrpB-like predicted nucleotidyltransferase (UPF0157 family) [Deinobacterium chartae]
MRETVRLTEVTLEVFERYEALAGRLAERIRELCPAARVEHVGATAVPGLLTKGDLDLACVLEAQEFAEAVRVLDRHFARAQPENWVEGVFASFELPALPGVPDLDAALQVTVRGSGYDFFVRLRDRMRASPRWRAEMNAAKRAQALEGPAAYRAQERRICPGAGLDRSGRRRRGLVRLRSVPAAARNRAAGQRAARER